MATSKLVQYLDSTGVSYLFLSHVPAFSAHEVAAVTHVPDKDLAKTLVVKADSNHWLAVLRADHRLNDRSLKKALGVKHVQLLSEEELSSLFPDCEVGAMPPFGNLYSIPVVVDKFLTNDDEIVFNACTHTESIKMKYKDFENLVKPQIAEFAEPPHSTEDREW
ncbi:MAG: YbaK/EbsC family protein [Bacteroidota bacterium]|nr:YbaK/EbsC family protein [Bacteroidota bacterium]